MKVLVDDQHIDAPSVEESTIGDVLRFVQGREYPADRVVVRFRRDGQEVRADEMEDVLQASIAECSKLEVFTHSKSGLVLDVMTEALTSLKQSEEHSRHSAGLLTEGKSVEGIQALGECVSVWQKVHEAVIKSIQMLEVDLQSTLISGQSLMESVVQPRDMLLQIRDALQSQDHVMLADLLQYEFGEVTKQWRSVITYLRDEADAREIGEDRG